MRPWCLPPCRRVGEVFHPQPIRGSRAASWAGFEPQPWLKINLVHFLFRWTLLVEWYRSKQVRNCWLLCFFPWYDFEWKDYLGCTTGHVQILGRCPDLRTSRIDALGYELCLLHHCYPIVAHQILMSGPYFNFICFISWHIGNASVCWWWDFATSCSFLRVFYWFWLKINLFWSHSVWSKY